MSGILRAAAQWAFGIITAMLLSAASAAEKPVGISGQPIVIPATVIIYQHTSVSNTDVVTPLLERLRVAIKPTVEFRSTSFQYADVSRNFRGKYDPWPIIERFHQAHGADAPPGAFRILLIGDDITQAPYNFLFAFSYGSETTDAHLSIVSLARLDDRTTGLPDRTRSARTNDRVFKLILKNIARLAGFTGGGGCIMTFARSVAELDLVPGEFCAGDAGQLRAAGILRP